MEGTSSFTRVRVGHGDLKPDVNPFGPEAQQHTGAEVWTEGLGLMKVLAVGPPPVIQEGSGGRYSVGTDPLVAFLIPLLHGPLPWTCGILTETEVWVPVAQVPDLRVAAEQLSADDRQRQEHPSFEQVVIRPGLRISAVFQEQGYEPYWYEGTVLGQDDQDRRRGQEVYEVLFDYSGESEYFPFKEHTFVPRDSTSDTLHIWTVGSHVEQRKRTRPARRTPVLLRSGAPQVLSFPNTGRERGRPPSPSEARPQTNGLSGREMWRQRTLMRRSLQLRSVPLQNPTGSATCLANSVYQALISSYRVQGLLVDTSSSGSCGHQEGYVCALCDFVRLHEHTTSDHSLEAWCSGNVAGRIRLWTRRLWGGEYGTDFGRRFQEGVQADAAAYGGAVIEILLACASRHPGVTDTFGKGVRVAWDEIGMGWQSEAVTPAGLVLNPGRVGSTSLSDLLNTAYTAWPSPGAAGLEKLPAVFWVVLAGAPGTRTDIHVLEEIVVPGACYPLRAQQNETVRVCAVVVRRAALAGGHYVAYVKEGGRWLEYDDHQVREVLLEEIQSQSRQVRLILCERLEEQEDGDDAWSVDTVEAGPDKEYGLALSPGQPPSPGETMDPVMDSGVNPAAATEVPSGADEGDGDQTPEAVDGPSVDEEDEGEMAPDVRPKRQRVTGSEPPDSGLSTAARRPTPKRPLEESGGADTVGDSVNTADPDGDDQAYDSDGVIPCLRGVTNSPIQYAEDGGAMELDPVALTEERDGAERGGDVATATVVESARVSDEIERPKKRGKRGKGLNRESQCVRRMRTKAKIRSSG